MLAVNLKTPSPLCLTPSGPAEPPAAPNPVPRASKALRGRAGFVASLDRCVPKVSSRVQALALWSLAGSKGSGQAPVPPGA